MGRRRLEDDEAEEVAAVTLNSANEKGGRTQQSR